MTFRLLTGSLLLSIIVLFNFSFAQLTPEEEKYIDSLKKVVHADVHDTLKINALYDWAEMIYFFDRHTDSIINRQIIQISEKNLQDKSTSNEERKYYFYCAANSYNIMGLYFMDWTEYDSAEHYFMKGIDYYKKIGRSQNIEGFYNNLGTVYHKRGDFKNAIACFETALKVPQISGHDSFVSSSLGSLGTCYSDLGEIDKAIEYYERGMEMSREKNDLFNLTSIMNGLAGCYVKKADYNKAYGYMTEAIKIDSSINNLYGLGDTYNELGKCMLGMEKYDSAIYFFQLGIELRNKVNNRYGISQSYIGLTEAYIAVGDYDAALKYGLKGKSFSSEMETVESRMGITLSLSKAAKHAGQYKLAYENFVEYFDVYQKMVNSENQKSLLKHELNADFERERLSDSLKFANEKQLSDLQYETDLKRKSQQQKGLWVGIGFMLILGAVGFRGYQRKKRDNLIIAEQKRKVEHAHQEITDSIAYAKRIQNAILPPAGHFQKLFPESFVLYLPKDVVSGDFYWLEEQQGHICFAAADCTGHGVPGAMVSVVCNNGLNRSVREYGIIDPGQILDKTRELVITEFEKSEEDVKDGMDISLCVIKDMKLTFAGAHNPAWIIRNNEIFDLKGDKQPVGKFDMSQPFKTQVFDLQKGDVIYSFTDGYADQFGGPEGKKFKAKAFRDLLIQIHHQPVDDQKMILQKSFEDWKGKLDQIDDICVIGVRV